MGNHIAMMIGEERDFASVDEYVAELIRRDLEAADLTVVNSHQVAVKRAFATPSSEYISISADEVIERNRRRRA